MADSIQSETWRDIPGYEGYYQASDLGGIKSLRRVIMRSNGSPQTIRERILKPAFDTFGYLHVVLNAPDKSIKTFRVHRLVMWAFNGPTPDGLEICHNDGEHTNNRLDNLRFDTHAANMADTVTHGVTEKFRTKECPQGHAYDEKNTGYSFRKSDGFWVKHCRACKRARWHAWEAATGGRRRKTA